jgi:hypothetical protein
MNYDKAEKPIEGHHSGDKSSDSVSDYEFYSEIASSTQLHNVPPPMLKHTLICQKDPFAFKIDESVGHKNNCRL